MNKKFGFGNFPIRKLNKTILEKVYRTKNIGFPTFLFTILLFDRHANITSLYIREQRLICRFVLVLEIEHDHDDVGELCSRTAKRQRIIRQVYTRDRNASYSYLRRYN